MPEYSIKIFQCEKSINTGEELFGLSDIAISESFKNSYP